MLHLSNKGSKKSYAAKAACFAAGLVAVFASSSVSADTSSRLCKLKGSDVILTIKRVGQTDAFNLLNTATQQTVSASEVNCTNADGSPVTVVDVNVDEGSAVRFLRAAGVDVTPIRH